MHVKSSAPTYEDQEEEEDDVPIPGSIHAPPPLHNPLDAERGERPHAETQLKAKTKATPTMAP